MDTNKRGIRFEMLEETYQRAMELARRHGWDRDWGEEQSMLLIFTRGLALVAQETMALQTNRSATDPEAELDRARRELVDLDSACSVLRFQAYTLQKDNEALNFKVTALGAENALALKRLAMFREEVERLKAELQGLRQENVALAMTGAAAECAVCQTREPVRPSPRRAYGKSRFEEFRTWLRDKIWASLG